jgi:Tfp pilus assembly protein PilF
MTGGNDRAAGDAVLPALDARLAAAPDDVDARIRRAGVLAAQGRAAEARADYLGVLARAPAHLGALNDLGTLLHAEGFLAAARTCYAEAIAHHPDAPLPRVNLANLLVEDGDLEAARTHYEAALARAPLQAEAHQGLARIHAEHGEDEKAAAHRRLGFSGRALAARPYHGAGAGIPLLELVAAAGGNVPTRFLIDPRIYRCSVVVADFFDPAAALPPHAAVFNAIGDADLARDALEAAGALLARTAAPIVNPPRAVLATGRAEIARRMAAIPGVVVPRIATFPRAALAGERAVAMLNAQGFEFPLLLRRPGFHAGRHFLRVDAAERLSEAVAALPGAELTAIEFLDAGGSDGLVRKYRVMSVDGALYPMHLAVARDWKVHYFTSDMAERDDHRAEEARFLADMTQAIGPAAAAALDRMREALALDYGGIDFGLDRHGHVLLFEANATMVVNPPEPDPRWDYRRAPVARIRDAVSAMLARHARP